MATPRAAESRPRETSDRQPSTGTGRWVSWLLGAAVLAAVVIASRHFSEARDFARLVERAEPWWIAVAVVLQAGTYLAQGQVYRLVARSAHWRLDTRTTYRMSLVKLFVDQAVPSAGLSGTAVVASGFERLGMPRSLVATAVAIAIVAGNAATALCLAVAMGIAAVRAAASPVLLAVCFAFGVFMLLLIRFVYALAGHARPAPRWLARFGPARDALAFVSAADPGLTKETGLLVRTTLCEVGVVLLDAATMWSLIRALGTHASPVGVFASFVLSNVVTSLGFALPGGLGIFEAVSIVTLRLTGVPVAVALSASLLYRGLSFWLPMLPGFWFSRREIKRPPRHAPTAEPPPGGTTAEERLDALLSQLGTSEDGLSTAEAARRLELVRRKGSKWRRRISAVVSHVRSAANPLVLILLVAGTASAVLGQVSDALTIAVIVLLSASINFWQTFRSERAARQLQQQVAPTATVRRDGRWVEITRDEVVAGDVVRIRAGDLVPADARLIESTDLHVQQAALTGESLPSQKEATRDALGSHGPDSPGLVYLGTSVVSGVGTGVVFAAGSATAFGDIVERLAARPEETEFERGTRRFGMLILQTVVFLTLFILIVNVSLGREALQSLEFSVALAVGLTPEFLPMITTVTLSQGAVQMSREKVIVKHLPSIQNLGSMDVLCSDKTGTLTSGTMTLDASLDPLGLPGDRALYLGQLNALFESGIKSPLDAAILERPQAGAEGFSKIGELPFDFERRRLSVAIERAGERLLITKGAPENVTAVCARYETDDGPRALDEAAAARCLDVFRAASERGFRVLAVAYRQLDVPSRLSVADERELTLAGYLTFADHLLEGAAESIASLRRDGVDVKILTGDNEIVTRHICEQVGLPASRIVLGSEMERMDQAALARVAEDAQIFARVSPAQKHQVVQALKGHGRVVGFLGDGINDAPSLHGADVGISVAGAVDIAREASDIILLEHKLEVLHAGILAGRRAFANVYKYLLMGTSSNFGNMFSMAGAALFLPFLPMLQKQILLNNLLYDVSQLTIPTDNVDPVFTRRPQRWDISFLRRFMLLIGPVSSIFDFLTFAVLLRVFHFGPAAFQTGWFVESLATQVLVLFVIRTTGRPWSNRPSTPLAFTVTAVAILGVALPYSPLAHPFGMVPLPLAFLLYVALVVPIYLALVELLKGALLRRTPGVTDHSGRGNDRGSASPRSNASI